MKKSSFTLLELVFVVAILILFAIMFNGCGKKNGPDGKTAGAANFVHSLAQSANCINNLKNMSSTRTQYLNDYRACWPNSESKSYAWSLARINHIPNDMTVCDYSCPSVERDPGQKGKVTEFDQSDIQMYASVGDYRAGQNGFGVLYFNSASLQQVVDHSGDVIADKSTSPSNRIWFADGLRPDTQRQRTLLIPEAAYTADRPGCARPYAVHDGQINLLVQDCSVTSVNPEELNGYYLPYFKGKGKGKGRDQRVYSVRAGTYISPDDPKKVLTVE